MKHIPPEFDYLYLVEVYDLYEKTMTDTQRTGLDKLLNHYDQEQYEQIDLDEWHYYIKLASRLIADDPND
jgi:hypothetical protein